MSREATLRAGYAALNRRDVPGLLANFDPSVEFVNPEEALEPGTRLGHAGLERALDAMLDAFDDYEAELEEVIELGDEVVAVVRERGTGAGSAVSVDQLTYHVFSFDGEKIVCFRWFHDREQALAAAGAGQASRT